MPSSHTRLQPGGGSLPAASGTLDAVMHALLVAAYVAVVAGLTLLMRWLVGEPE